MSAVAVVTDSTAALPAELNDRLTVVPLTVVVAGRQGREGHEIALADVIGAWVERPLSVTTSQPAPAAFVEQYRRLLADGHTAILSVHLSAQLSGTASTAALAAAEFPGRVAVVDSRSAGMGLGFPALAAAEAAASGQDLPRVRAAAEAAIASTTTFFSVETLEFLRRGGRIGAAAALLGTALAVKPILRVADGGIVVSDRVRTTSRALTRLVDLAVEEMGSDPVEIAVHHLAAPDRAQMVLGALLRRAGERVRRSYLTEVGAAVGAHVGPGLVGVVVHRLPEDPG
jgi:fatty acid kinase fatty acid binding subunit